MAVTASLWPWCVAGGRVRGRGFGHARVRRGCGRGLGRFCCGSGRAGCCGVAVALAVSVAAVGVVIPGLGCVCGHCRRPKYPWAYECERSRGRVCSPGRGLESVVFLVGVF